MLFTVRGSALLIAFLLVLTLGLVGCGGSAHTASTGGVTPPNSAPTPAPAPVPATCPSVTVQEAVGPSSGTAAFPAPAPTPPPTPGTTLAGSVCISSPADGATVTSPAHIEAVTTLSNIDHMRVFVDGKAEFFTFYNTIDALLWMTPGTHQVEVLATDKSGNNASTSLSVNVSSDSTAPVAQIQQMPNWEPCSAVFPPGDPRAGQVCAAGVGMADSSMTENQSSPSLSGGSAKFTMGGPTPYSNELYTKFLGGGSYPTQFTYDLYFMVDHPDRPQALEFDVNQTFGNTRWVFGTECNFKGSGKWDVWDAAKGWQPTTIACNPFPANTWIHLVWKFERVGDQVHYISLTVNDQTYPLDLYYSDQPGWTMEDIDVAFQMDGDYAQQPYTVWLDNVSLTAQ